MEFEKLVDKVKKSNLYKLCDYELNFKDYIFHFPENIYKYDYKTLENKRYYDLIVDEREIIFDEHSKLIKDFYDIDGILLKLYTNKTFKNFSGAILRLQKISNSKLIKNIADFKYYILKTPIIKREDIILKINNSIIIDVLPEIKYICDILISNYDESNNNDNIKIIEFCLYIFEKHFKILFTFCKDDINEVINFKPKFQGIEKQNIKTIIDTILNNAIEYKEKINKLTN